jgi:DNA-binding MurR/RpiR family transcriptional regulator
VLVELHSGRTDQTARSDAEEVGPISGNTADLARTQRAVPRPFPPTPAQQLLQQAAARLDSAPAIALAAALAVDFPRSLERRPAQLLRSAGATAEDLDRLVRAAGFADLDDLRRQAADELGVRLTAPDLRFTYRGDGVASDRTGLDRTLRREQDNLAETLESLQRSGSLELAARAILTSRRRWVLGDLKSRGYAQLFAADLTSSLGSVTLIEPNAAAVLSALSDAHRLDSLTVFCFRRYSRLSVRVAQHFAALGATVIAVTDTEDSPVCAHATHALRVSTRSDTPTHSPTAVTAIGHALAALTAAGAKGAAKRGRHKRALAASMEWYELDEDEL